MLNTIRNFCLFVGLVLIALTLDFVSMSLFESVITLLGGFMFLAGLAITMYQFHSKQEPAQSDSKVQ